MTPTTVQGAPVVVPRQPAAQRGLRAERFEQGAARHGGHPLDRLGAGLQIERVQSGAAHALEGAGHRRGVRELGRGEVVRQRQESGGIRIRKGPQQDAVDDAEDRGVGADAEREGRDGHCGESRVRREAAQGEAQILAESSHASS
jgi:hypothetical protein